MSSSKKSIAEQPKGDRELRASRRIDYKLMNSGNTGFELAQDSQSGAMAAGFGGTIDDAPPSVSLDPEVERQQLQDEMAALHEEEERLKTSMKLAHMRQEVQKKRQAVKKLRGMTEKTVGGASHVSLIGDKSSLKSKHDAESGDSDLDINDLRKDPNLRVVVQKELEKLGLGSVGSVDSDSSGSAAGTPDSSDSDVSSAKKHKKKSKSKKSGINAKASDRVKFPQSWPHAHLQYEYVNKQMTYDELDFKMFIAGELEIISSEGLPRSERLGRTSLLKKIIYYSNTYEFKGLKSFYAAWLRQIELGKKAWSDDPQQLESAILTKHLRVQRSSSSAHKKESVNNKKDKDDGEEKVWFCSQFQRNKCSHKGTHMVVVKGRMRQAQHICATCWMTDKAKLGHPESSSSCPHASA